jgi:hypothetical protein
MVMVMARPVIVSVVVRMVVAIVLVWMVVIVCGRIVVVLPDRVLVLMFVLEDAVVVGVGVSGDGHHRIRVLPDRR